MKTILIITAMFAGILTNAQITEIDTFYLQNGNTITVLATVKQEQVLAQFFVSDSTEFSTEELKTLTKTDGLVQKIMKSDDVLTGLLPPKETKMGLMTGYYRFNGQVLKGSSEVKALTAPEFEWWAFILMALSTIGILIISIRNAATNRRLQFFLFCGVVTAGSAATLFFISPIAVSIVIVSCLVAGWLGECCVESFHEIDGILFGAMSSLLPIIFLLNGGSVSEPYLASFRSVYWQLVLFHIGICILGIVLREVIVRYREIRDTAALMYAE